MEVCHTQYLATNSQCQCHNLTQTWSEVVTLITGILCPCHISYYSWPNSSQFYMIITHNMDMLHVQSLATNTQGQDFNLVLCLDHLSHILRVITNIKWLIPIVCTIHGLLNPCSRSLFWHESRSASV